MHIITDPPEIFLQITSHLPHGDLFQLIQVSKSVQALVEPLLWREIELHRPHYHEDLAVDKCSIHRPYKYDVAHGLFGTAHQTHYLDQYYSKTARIFIKKFENPSEENDRLARHVRWLCLEVDMYEDDSVERNCWNALTQFVNLEYLEIHARWTSYNEVEQLDAAAAPLEKLHTIKLRGFVPNYFVEYLLRRPSQIKELELAVLDNPIGSNLHEPRENPPPDQPEVPEDFEGMTDEEVNALDELEEFDGEEIAPRPLLCIPNTIVSQFKNLTHLWLCKPTNVYDGAELRDMFQDMYFSEPSDTKSFHEWANLLTATKDTLTHLTLEHRPTTGEIESDSTESDEFMRLRSEGPSYRRFREIVLPILLNPQGWSALKQITLIGVEYNSTSCTNCARFDQPCDKIKPACEPHPPQAKFCMVYT